MTPSTCINILAAVEQIKTYTHEVSFQEFLQTGIIQDGVIRQLEIIEEATRNRSPQNSARDIQKCAGVR